MDGVNWKAGVDGLFLTFYRFVFGTPSQLISLFELRGDIKRERLLILRHGKRWLLHMTIMSFMNWLVWPFPNESYQFFNRVLKNRDSFFFRRSFGIFWQRSRQVDWRSECDLVWACQIDVEGEVYPYYSTARMGTGSILAIPLFGFIFFLHAFHIDILAEDRVRWIFP